MNERVKESAAVMSFLPFLLSSFFLFSKLQLNESFGCRKLQRLAEVPRTGYSLSSGDSDDHHHRHCLYCYYYWYHYYY